MINIKIGDKIGPFEIVGKDDYTKQWIGKCFCGNIVKKYAGQFDFRQKTCGDRTKHDKNFLAMKDKIEFDIQNKTRYGDLIVNEYLGYYSNQPNGMKRHHVKCLCNCGNVVERLYVSILSGDTFSCGMHRTKPVSKISSHITPLIEEKYYLRWQSMHNRCYNKTRHNYHLYGGKGIEVCDEWRYYPGDKTKQEVNRQNYKNYEKWLDEQLKKEGLTYEQFVQLNYSVDRIDNNGNYTPNNCRISSQIEQCNNKDTNRNLYYKGKAIRPMELSRTSDFHWKRVYNDLKDVEYDTNALIQKRPQYLFWIEKFINLFYSLSPYIRDNYTFLIDQTDHYNFDYLVHKKYKHVIKSSNEKKTIKDYSGREYYIPERIRYQ